MVVEVVFEVSGIVSRRAFFVTVPVSSSPKSSPVLFFAPPAFLSHCWCKYLQKMVQHGTQEDTRVKRNPHLSNMLVFSVTMTC